jgi:hypothetical protein
MNETTDPAAAPTAPAASARRRIPSLKFMQAYSLRQPIGRRKGRGLRDREQTTSRRGIDYTEKIPPGIAHRTIVHASCNTREKVQSGVDVCTL